MAYCFNRISIAYADGGRSRWLVCYAERLLYMYIYIGNGDNQASASSGSETREDLM